MNFILSFLSFKLCTISIYFKSSSAFLVSSNFYSTEAKAPFQIQTTQFSNVGIIVFRKIIALQARLLTMFGRVVVVSNF